jgi:hypothetical protein
MSVTTIDDTISVLTNKTFDTTSTWGDATDNTKKLAVQLSGATTSTTVTIASAHTTNRTFTLPDATDTAAVLAAAQTFTNKTMTATSNNVTAKGLFSATTTVDTSAATAPTVGQVLTATGGTAANWQDTAALANMKDTINYVYNAADSTKQQKWSLSGATTGTATTLVFAQTANRNITFPDATDTVVLLAATQTVSGKTLDSGANTLTVTSSPLSAANINTLLNQALLTTSSPSFTNLTTTGTSLSLMNSYLTFATGTQSVTSATPVTVVTSTIGNGKGAYIRAIAIVYNSTDSTSGFFELSARVTNVGGTVTIGGYVIGRNNRGSGFSGAALTFTPSGGNVLVQYGGTAGKTHAVKVTVDVRAT